MRTVARRYWVDSLAVTLGVATFADNARIGWPIPVLAISTVAWVAAVLARRRVQLAPLAVPITLALQSSFGPHIKPSRGDFIVLLLSAGVMGAQARDWRLDAISVVTFPIGAAGMLYSGAAPDPAGNAAFITAWTFAALALGALAARHSRRAEQQRTRWQHEQHLTEQRTRRAVEQERINIARELHDIIGHGVSVMTIQAGAARTLLANGDHPGARNAFVMIEETGHSALADMRRLLGILRNGSTPPALQAPPGLGRLPALAEVMANRGLHVELAVDEQAPGLPFGLDAVSYRIVEEALNRAVASGATTAAVALRRTAAAFRIEVRDDRTSADPLGVSDTGLEHRVALYGGRIEMGCQPGESAVLTAVLPLEVNDT